MSMTPDQIYQLSSVGQIPADADLSAVARPFIGDVNDPSMFGAIRLYNKREIFIPYGTAKTASGVQLDMSSSNLSTDVAAWRRMRVVAIVTFAGTGTWNIQCSYTHHTNTSVTMTTRTGYGNNESGGLIYSWIVNIKNFSKNTKFKLCHT